MLVSIEKELDKQVKTSKQESGIDAVFEVNQILNNSAKKDLKTLTFLSPTSDNTELIRYVHETTYNLKTYNIEEIKNIAIKYKLKFLCSYYFTGSFDNQLISKLNQSGLPTDAFSLGCKYFILAPEELFNVRNVDYKNLKSLDPLLFYKIDDNHFCLIHKWGNDFTWFRRIEGWKWENFRNYSFFHLFFGSLLMTSILFILSYTTILKLPFFNILLMGVGLGCLVSYFLKIRKKISRIDAPNEEYFTPKRWDNIIVLR